MELIERLKMRVREPNVEPDEDILEDCLESAKAAIMNRRFPYGDCPEELESRYLDLQFRMALDLYNRVGAEGQLSHSENGVSVTWGAEMISEQLLNEVVPYCGVTR